MFFKKKTKYEVVKPTSESVEFISYLFAVNMNGTNKVIDIINDMDKGKRARMVDFFSVEINKAIIGGGLTPMEVAKMEVISALGIRVLLSQVSSLDVIYAIKMNGHDRDIIEAIEVANWM